MNDVYTDYEKKHSIPARIHMKKFIRLRKYLKYLLDDLTDPLNLSRFRFYRAWKGGIWYKHQLNGELPNCYGSFWARYGKINRYTDIIKKEDYTRL